MEIDIKNIKRQLSSSPLPGKRIQYVMAPKERNESDIAKTAYQDAAVSILLYEKENELYFPLIRRAKNQNDKHTGQISLPGGRYEENDGDFFQCALRELSEELGINTKSMEKLGQLTDTYIPVSGYKVHSFVLYNDKEMHFTPQAGEVEYILEIKLKDLLNEKNIKTGEIECCGRIANDIPYFLLNNHKVWGATAMILNEFRHVILRN